MVRNLEEYGRIEEDLVSLLRKLLAELPANVASINVRSVFGGTVAVLQPTNPSSACVVTHAERGLPLVDFSFGKYSPTWELPAEGYTRDATKAELLLEVEQMCKAVIAGRCEHRRGFLSVSGEVRVGNRSYRARNVLVWRVAPPFNGVQTYEPYDPHGR